MTIHEIIMDYFNYTDFMVSMCGPNGLKTWSVELNDLDVCFQELCLQTPALILLGLLSAYYCGKAYTGPGNGRRGRPDGHENWKSFARSLITAILALIPIVRMGIATSIFPGTTVYVDYLIAGVEFISWLTYLAYLRTSQIHNSNNGPFGPTSLCIIWTLSLILSAICLRSRFILHHSTQLPIFIPLFTLFYGFSLTAVIIQSLFVVTVIPCGTGNVRQASHDSGEQDPLLGSANRNAYGGFQEEQDPFDLGVALESTSFLQRLFFSWVSPLMQKGSECKLKTSDDVFDLPIDMRPGILHDRLNSVINSEQTHDNPLPDEGGHESINCDQSSSVMSSSSTQLTNDEPLPRVTLFKALHICFGVRFYSVGILKLVADCANFGAPLLLNRLVTFIEARNEPITNGYLYAAGLFAVTLISAFCTSHFNFLVSLLGLKIRAALVTQIYRKTITLSHASISGFSIGEIVNFMSTDTDRIVNACPSFHSLWSIPLQIGVTLYLLYNQVGISFLAGVGFTLVLIPINKVIASKIGQLSTKMMSRKDDRVKMTTEMLGGIRVIKAHVWEDHFFKLIDGLRVLELKYLRGRKYLDALCVYFWATTPVLITILTFTTYVLLGNQLSAAMVFTSIALLNMLIAPLNAFPWVLNGLVEAWVSLKRVERLLELPDLDPSEYYVELVPPRPGLDIFVKNASFSWKQDDVAGDLLTPTLQNIHLTVKRGELIGIMGPVGSGKSTLIAAILAEVEKTSGTVSLVNQINGYGLVSQVSWLQRGTIRDNILFGKTFDRTRYKLVLDACCLADDINALPMGDFTNVGEGGTTLSGGQKARVALARAVYQDRKIYFLDDILSAVDVQVAKMIFKKCINGLLRKKTRILCTHDAVYLQAAHHVILLKGGKIWKQGKPSVILSEYGESLSLLSYDGISSLGSVGSGDEDSGISSVVHDMGDEETSEVGTLRFDVYKSYCKAIGYCLSFSILASIVLMQTSRNMTDWWLSYWVTHMKSIPANVTSEMQYHFSAQNSSGDVEFYLKGYGLIAAGNSVFTLIRAFLFAYGGVHAAETTHRYLLTTIIRARPVFFDETPMGRILNRFSSDTSTIDDSLPFILNILLAQLFSVIGTLAIVIYGLPWLVLVLIPLVPIYYYLQNLYRLASRELKRLSSVTLSPVYNHFNETLSGLTTIRAYKAVARFKLKNEVNLEENLKCQFASQAACQWLGLRLQFIGVAIVTGVCVIAVLQHQFDIANPGLVGLAISYSLAITGMLNGVVNAFTETEKEMIAVERVQQYINEVELERNTEASLPFAWPSQAVVCFNNVILRYRTHLIPSLKDVSFVTRPAEKIGVVGRTGAGKSSLFVALFRLTELGQGEITIDSVDISKIGLKGLRSRLAIIPQDPFLFSGTVSENVDPLGKYSKVEIWNALARCRLDGFVRDLGGLDFKIEYGGKNLSSGQRQLFCLVRALLHNAKVVCIDEATANVDKQTDVLIQQTLLTSFPQSTVFTIAHRINTIMDSDRVIVMGGGMVLEFDTPYNLMQNETSQFFKLVNGGFD